MTFYITGYDSIVKHAYYDRLGKQQKYTCASIGWVHRCMDWVTPRVTPLGVTFNMMDEGDQRTYFSKSLHWNDYQPPVSVS